MGYRFTRVRDYFLCLDVFYFDGVKFFGYRFIEGLVRVRFLELSKDCGFVVVVFNI